MSVPFLGRNPTDFTQLCRQDPSVGTSRPSSHMGIVTHKLGVAPTPAPTVLCILGGFQGLCTCGMGVTEGTWLLLLSMGKRQRAH